MLFIGFTDPYNHTYILKAHDKSSSKIIREHKYKDNDKDKDAERRNESLTVCYIFGILMTQAFQE